MVLWWRCQAAPRHPITTSGRGETWIHFCREQGLRQNQSQPILMLSSVPVAAAPASAEPQRGQRSLLSSNPITTAPAPAEPAEPPGGARSLLSSFQVTAAQDTAAPQGGVRSLSSRTPVAAAPAPAEPPGYARSLSSRTPVAAGLWRPGHGCCKVYGKSPETR